MKRLADLKNPLVPNVACEHTFSQMNIWEITFQSSLSSFSNVIKHQLYKDKNYFVGFYSKRTRHLKAPKIIFLCKKNLTRRFRVICYQIIRAKYNFVYKTYSVVSLYIIHISLYIWYVRKSFKGVSILLLCIFLLIVFISFYNMIGQLSIQCHSLQFKFC